MQRTILDMHKSLQDDCYLAFISANNDYDFGVKKKDEMKFLDEKHLLVKRESGRQTIINLDLIIGVCIKVEWI